MSAAVPNAPIRRDPNALPPPKWWGKYVLEGNPPQRRFVFQWKAIIAAIGCAAVAFYLSAVTALWGYYSMKRAIPGVHWVDVAVPSRFSHVQDAIGTFYLGQAKEALKKGDIVRAVVTARASLVKSPSNLDARFFLADTWYGVGRPDEAVRTLRDGIKFNAKDTRLQTAFVNLCLTTNHYAVLLAALRTDFPAQGVRLLDGSNRAMQLAEVRAVMETAGPAEADRAAVAYPGLAEEPLAAPLLAQIYSAVGRKQQAFELLKSARARTPNDANIEDAYIEIALALGNSDEARKASEHFYTAFPDLLGPKLRFLEAHGSRQGADEKPWTSVAMIILAEYRHKPDALAQLGSLAASKGWTDLTFLLYENSLQENLTGFPFATYYAASLVKAGDLKTADAVLRELSIRNGAQMASASYLVAMVDWGTGRESEASQIVQQLHRETADDPFRRRKIEDVFRTFGYPKVADQLVAGGS
jgi:tetratricopeptide (TPR) repeat protein